MRCTRAPGSLASPPPSGLQAARARSGASGTSTPHSVPERARIRWHVDGVLTQRLNRDYVKRTFMRGCKHHVGRGAVEVGTQPVRCGDAPAISWHQPWEPEMRHRGDQVVADGTLMIEELGGHD